MNSMAQGSGVITEVRLEAEGLSGRIACPPGLWPSPGQYMAANSTDLMETLPVVLYPAGVEQNELWVAAPLPPGWTTGTRLSLRGPLGRGFQVPSTAMRVGLACLDGSPARLLPLAYQALDRRASVAVYSAIPVTGLPPEIEILPLDLLPEAPAWADYLALDVSSLQLANVRAQFRLRPYERPTCQVQVLVRTPMPCTGLAECGVCAVSTQAGWKLVCVDGPVFDFNTIEWG